LLPRSFLPLLFASVLSAACFAAAVLSSSFIINSLADGICFFLVTAQGLALVSAESWFKSNCFCFRTGTQGVSFEPVDAPES
jgi:hypothetical protein